MKGYIIEKEKLKNNIETVKKRADGKAIYAVVKGNGYGFGLIQFARFLRDYGIDKFAVTEPSDAVKLRMAGFIDEEILVMRSVYDERDVDDIIESRAVATIGSYNDAVLLSGIADKHNEVVEAHIKLDVGMGRYGFLPSEMDKISSVFKFFAKINVTGMYTHLPCAFADAKRTQEQINLLVETAKKLRDSGLTPVGYGRCEVTEIRWLPEGHTVGYGSAFVAKKPTRVAVIPLGYADGFTLTRDRDIFRFRDKLRYMLSDAKLFLKRKKLYVTINGKKAPVLGHVGMVHTTVNVTDIPCECGDTAVFEISPLYAGEILERVYE